MKKTILLIAFLFSTAIYTNICAQITPPSISGDKDLRDTDVKRRSIEMERVERDARKKPKAKVKNQTAANPAPETEGKLAARYGEIKTDYEQIQLAHDAIIKAYQSGGKIDYAQIGKSALAINKSATRLDLNLFPAPIENAEKEVKKDNKAGKEKKENKSEKEIKPARSVRDLIVDLDNTIGNLVMSQMFQNLRTVDAVVSAKAKLDLEKIIELSAALDREAGKMTNGEK